MIINNQFNRLFWGTVIADIKNNLHHPIEMDHKIFGKIKVDMKNLSRDSIHQLLKQLTDFPKDENGVAKSLKDITNKDLVNHIDHIKLIMNENSFTFRADELEWNRLILQANR